MGRLCERPGCSDVASMAFGFDVDRLLVWLAHRDPDGDGLRAGSLCKRHADAMVVPRGWTLDDRREPTPRLFPTGSPDEPVRARRRPTAAATPEPLALDTVDGASGHRLRTVAEVIGAPLDDDDPDATVPIPWLPTYDPQDDLDGVLAAHTPLLARAFRGTERPR